MTINFNNKYFNLKFLWLDEIDSTNTFVKKNQNILEDKTLVATLNQTNGYGTKGRDFFCIPSKTLCYSILLKDISIEKSVQISFITSICLVETLKNLSIKNARIKWFNDIIIENKKIAGILTESSIFKNKANFIIGIGINLFPTEEELKNLGLFNAASIFSKTNKKINPDVFLRKFVEFFEIYFMEFVENEKNKKKLIEIYKNYCKTLEKQIKICNNKTKKIFFAKAIDISQDGKLLVSKNNKVFSVDCSGYSIFH